MNVLVTPEGNVTLRLDELLGTYRTFGRLGPAYEIVGVAGPASGRDVMLKVRVIESGEELSYPLDAALVDPVAN